MAGPTDDVQLIPTGVRRISTDTEPDELVLPSDTERRLGWIADWLAQPLPVFREWGLQRYIDGGLRAIFRGPPGTGKTMAVTALGRSTERPVLQVDPRAIVSKYIGETEKNLHQLFDVAAEQKAILLFDEADALFGQRPYAKDAHDRHANEEIGHLLRRIEPYEGLAIVTSNAAAKLDDDILSRIDLIVDFPLPDETSRALLWRKILGTLKLPQGSDVDVERLAGEFDFSGAEILRCARLAAMLAAGGDRPVDMNLLESAAAQRAAMRGS